MSGAYLVLFIDTRTLMAREAGVFSQSARHLPLSSKYFAVDVLERRGRDYEEARQALRSVVFTDPTFSWMLPLLKNVA